MLHGKKHKDPTTIALASNAGGRATFTVTTDDTVPNDAYNFWVSNICYDADGVVVTSEYHPVVWTEQTETPTDGTTDPFTTDGTSPFAGAVVTASAFVGLFPNVWFPISNTVTYTPS